MSVKPLFYPHVACQPWLRPAVLDPIQVINCWREPYVPGFGLSWTGNQRYVLPPIMVRLSVKATLAQLVCSAQRCDWPLLGERYRFRIRLLSRHECFVCFLHHAYFWMRLVRAPLTLLLGYACPMLQLRVRGLPGAV